MRILVTGSRDWPEPDNIECALIDETMHIDEPRQVTVVHGGARGADAMVDNIARRLGFNVEVHPAAWDTRGRAAGAIRNSEMVRAGADVCLAFIWNGSSGASNCADAAERAGIYTRRFIA